MNQFVTGVINQLVTDAVGTQDTDLFASPEKPVQIGIVPANAVFAFTSDGYMPLRTFGTACPDQRRVFVQITVRREPQDYHGGDAKAEAVWQSLEQADLSGDITNFVWCKSLRSAPTYIGQNKDKYHIWTMQFEVSFMDAV
jgi:hypothetical protein